MSAPLDSKRQRITEGCTVHCKPGGRGRGQDCPVVRDGEGGLAYTYILVNKEPYNFSIKEHNPYLTVVNSGKGK